MAMINCEDCDQPISNKADSCLHCGCPVTLNHSVVKQKIHSAWGRS